MKKRSMAWQRQKRRGRTHIIEKKNAEESHMQKMNSGRKKKKDESRVVFYSCESNNIS